MKILKKQKSDSAKRVFSDLGLILHVLFFPDDPEGLSKILDCPMSAPDAVNGDIYMHQSHKGRRISGESEERARQMMASMKKHLVEIIESES